MRKKWKFSWKGAFLSFFFFSERERERKPCLFCACVFGWVCFSRWHVCSTSYCLLKVNDESAYENRLHVRPKRRRGREQEQLPEYIVYQYLLFTGYINRARKCFLNSLRQLAKPASNHDCLPEQRGIASTEICRFVLEWRKLDCCQSKVFISAAKHRIVLEKKLSGVSAPTVAGKYILSLLID